MKKDGHTHTHFCPHGSGEDTEKFILKAIELNFDSYALTEHPPLPDSFKSLMPYDEELISLLAMQENDLDDYIKQMLELKSKYKDQLDIRVGLEMDFLPDHISWTENLLNEYGKYLDETILSVHFLKWNQGWRCLDLNPDDFQNGLFNYYKNYEAFQLEYFNLLKEAINTDYGKYSPAKIGHITLCQKFQNYFLKEDDIHITDRVKSEIYTVLQLIKERSKKLDFNFAGLYKPYCKEPYPSQWIAKEAINMGIELEYGSDAHKVAEVGRGYGIYEDSIGYI